MPAAQFSRNRLLNTSVYYNLPSGVFFLFKLKSLAALEPAVGKKDIK